MMAGQVHDVLPQSHPVFSVGAAAVSARYSVVVVTLRRAIFFLGTVSAGIGLTSISYIPFFFLLCDE